MERIDRWIEHAERSLFALATELRRVPLAPDTRRLHLRALELKRAIKRWRDEAPDDAAIGAALEEIEELARAACLHANVADRSRSAALAALRARAQPTSAGRSGSP